MKTIRGKTPVRRLWKEAKSLHPPQREVAFLLQDWDDAYNVGGMFRVADGLGATLLVMTGHTPVPPDPMISVTSLGAHRRVPWERFEKHEEAALAVVAAGWSLVAVEIAEEAVCYLDYSFPDRVCLALGNEASGVYGNVLKHCEGAVYVPMLGKGRSLNVHVSAAIVGYHARLDTGTTEPGQ